jgi:hypothetical protein
VAESTGGSPLSKLLQGEEGFATPDVSRAQALAVGQAAVALAVVLGFDISDDVQNAIIALSIALGVALPASDAYIRKSRATNATEIAKARLLDSSAGSTMLASAQLRLARAELEVEQAYADD